MNYFSSKLCETKKTTNVFKTNIVCKDCIERGILYVIPNPGWNIHPLLIKLPDLQPMSTYAVCTLFYNILWLPIKKCNIAIKIPPLFLTP
ncbi:hypothetical protein GJ496_007242 [Pomphorhynchus laevis]|nr:hypothetical protein GJ496_007242 [Pomphorhynchus laevis]